MKCKRHPRYLAKREPTSTCRACWRVFVQQEATRQLAAAHKAATGQMVEIDVGSLKNEKGPEEILLDLQRRVKVRLLEIETDARYQSGLRQPALVQVNAPLALIQTSLEAEHAICAWILNLSQKGVS